MTKKIAVLVRERQEEALRMATGITLLDDAVSVFVLDNIVAETEKNILNIETLLDLDIPVYSNNPANKMLEHLTTEEIAHRLVAFDHVIPY